MQHLIRRSKISGCKNVHRIKKKIQKESFINQYLYGLRMLHSEPKRLEITGRYLEMKNEELGLKCDSAQMSNNHEICTTM